jgi:hypothetical protein
MSLTREKRQRLLHVYLSEGFSAAKPLALHYGINPRSLSKYSRAAGIPGKRGRPMGKRMPKGTPRSVKWGWAIERGAIIA